jgi:hypothetical protein
MSTRDLHHKRAETYLVVILGVLILVFEIFHIIILVVFLVL